MVKVGHGFLLPYIYENETTNQKEFIMITICIALGSINCICLFFFGVHRISTDNLNEIVNEQMILNERENEKEYLIQD